VHHVRGEQRADEHRADPATTAVDVESLTPDSTGIREVDCLVDGAILGEVLNPDRI
jgi:hypothetical protein